MHTMQKCNSLALKCLFMQNALERNTKGLQYYVSNLSYMNHLLELIRDELIEALYRCKTGYMQLDAD